ncbi:amiloride-sensitive sodium channel subunit delta [Bos indicus]|uniref:Sodium channel epithelial 1 subunit delta n=3 Tax=Bos TaxID=9903 RepID=F1MY57_BOVIN|nr:amiloride-sensitive sodium channel subunit delta isoform X1 [Bos taurus]XP_019832202.1 PREDICTED: amiloride-sensitive sodium channel subunit delta [Bos indicus]XP_027421052.1 amiloride-sensitive sodium channel subunit delta isoform X1 [Bos indicus x Bos taurus]XP_061239090.1 amiloride-sensitive sodium channel subunit delta isoform X1 [Bos javanicus]XP_061239091.1 amiloride-sensitive sodium channel subunit delta isoform X1 [Bos javanicus]
MENGRLMAQVGRPGWGQAKWWAGAPLSLTSQMQAEGTGQTVGGGPGTWTCPQASPPTLPEEEHGERLVELHASFRELVTFFCTNSTIHGTIRLVCSSQNRLKTASWGLLLAGALGVLYWQFALLFEQYWRYPVIMTVSVHSERKLFPSVTLCDMNPHRPHLARHHLRVLDDFARESIYSLYRFNFSDSMDALGAEVPGPEPAFHLDRRIRLQRLRPLDGQNRVGFKLCNSTGGDCVERAYSSGVVAAREWYRFHYINILALLPAAHEDSHGSHFVFSCRYDDRDCHAQHFQTSHHPTYGSCYTFNGVWAAQRPGVTHRISLVLRAEQLDHLPLLSTKAGIKVMIHPQDHTPFLEHQGFSIRPGTETTIDIREDEVHRLGSPYGQCMDSTGSVDVQLLYNTSYTRQACLVSCFQHLMVETCSCGYFFYPLPAGAEYCSYMRHPAWGHCFHHLYQKLKTHQLPCTTRCPRPCRESSYKLSAGTSRWPSSTSADWVLAVLGEPSRRNPWPSSASIKSWPLPLPSSPSRARTEGPTSRSGAQPLSPEPCPSISLAKVNIFYQELNYRTVDETPVYSVPQLLSAMGSLWSLWFGSSVLSVVEVLELLLDAIALTLLLCCRWLCGSRGQPRAATRVHPPSQRPASGPVAADTTSNAPGPGCLHLPRCCRDFSRSLG